MKFIYSLVCAIIFVSSVIIPVRADSGYIYYDENGNPQAVECYTTDNPEIINCAIGDALSTWISSTQSEKKKAVILITDWGEMGFIELHD